MNNDKWGIIFCPKSGVIKPQKRWQKVEAALAKHKIDYDYVQSETSGSVERLVKMFINNGYKTIIIVGGDSALNDAVNCIMLTEKELRQDIKLGVIPNGLMNDFARFWDIYEDEEDKLIEGLKKGRTRKIDLGCVRYSNKSGDSCRRYFLNCVNIGLIATMMNLRRTTRHFFGSRTLSFASSFLLMIFQRMEYNMHLKINTEILQRKIMTVCIGNARGYGQTPSAVPYNGTLDVSVVYHPEIAQLFEGLYMFIRGKFLNSKRVHPYRTQQVDVFEAQHALLSIDGRLAENAVTPYKITVEQEVINFIIP